MKTVSDEDVKIGLHAAAAAVPDGVGFTICGAQVRAAVEAVLKHWGEECSVTEQRPNAPGSNTPAIYTEADFDFVDPGIRREVTLLSQHGIETFESCEGGPGHTFPEPTIRFCGGRDQGFKALHIALQYDLRPANLRRYYSIIDGEPVGPAWEMTFKKPDLPNWYEWSKGRC